MICNQRFYKCYMTLYIFVQPFCSLGAVVVIYHLISIIPFITRQSEMANTSPCHIPVLGDVPPIKIENFYFYFPDVISLLARVFIFLIDRATQEIAIQNI